MEQHPSAAAENLNIPLIVIWEQANDQIPQGFLSAYPGHKAIDGYHLQPDAWASNWEAYLAVIYESLHSSHKAVPRLRYIADPVV